MDYFGALVDDLTDIVEELEELHPRDGQRLARGLRRLLKVAVETERMRERHRRDAAEPGAPPAEVEGTPAGGEAEAA